KRQSASCFMCISMGSANAGSLLTKSPRRRLRRLWITPASISTPCSASWKRNERLEPMPSFSRNLEQSLHRALAIANERHHEYATLEHLLLALLDDQDAAAVMRACNVDLDKLRRSLTAYLESELENVVSDNNEDSKPTAGFQRVIQRAVIHVQSSGREEVTGSNVLVAIFAERESH